MEVLRTRVGGTRSMVIRAVLMCAFAGISASFAALAHAAQFSVDAVKAAYLFRFAQYVEWPSSPSADTPFVIAISGAEEVAVHLERLSPGMTVNGRRVVVRRATRVQDLDGVHMFFIGESAFSRSRALRAHAAARPILIVTEVQEGIESGAVINFIEVNRNLRFEISLNAADRSGLRINSALLSVAARVERRPQGALNCNDSYLRRHRPWACGIRMASVDIWRGM